MTCHNCQIACNRFGKHRNGLQRFRCSQCRKTFTEDHQQPSGDMRLPIAKAEAILKLLVEGMSLDGWPTPADRGLEWGSLTDGAPFPEA